MTLVSLTDGTAAAAQRRARDVQVDDRVGPRLGEDAPDGRLPDVRLDEVRAAQMVPVRDGVHADDPVHVGITLDAPHEPAPS